MAKAPLWAKAVKYGADVLTTAGDGLTLGLSPLVKGGIGYGIDNTLKAAGVREGEYEPLANYIQPYTKQIADAAENAGAVGTVANVAGNLLTGGGLGALAYKGATKVPGLASKIVPRVYPQGATVTGAPLASKVDVGKILKTGMGAAGAGTTALVANGFAPELSDFEDPTTSSATMGPKQGSAQLGAAAAEKSAEPLLTKGQQMMINALSGMSLDKRAKMIGTYNAGASPTKQPTQKDIMLQRLDTMLDQQMKEQIAAGVDPRKAQADYLRNASALVAPSGVPFLTSPEE